MNTDFDPQTDFEQVRRSSLEFQSLIDRLGSRLNTKAPGVSDWSSAQHLFHVTLATDLGLANVLSLLRGKGILIRPDGELHPDTRAVLLADGIPRGQADAPRMVLPGDLVEAAQIVTEVKNVGHSLDAIDPMRAALPECPGWIKHQVLGPLQAKHWLRFCNLHAEHHLKIIREIEAALPV